MWRPCSPTERSGQLQCLHWLLKRKNITVELITMFYYSARELGHEILQDVLGAAPSTVGEETMIENTSFREAAKRHRYK